MRHKYATQAVVLGRTPIGEASAFVTLLTPDLGLVRARAQSVRRTGAKLASALQTFAECDVILVRGKEGWRLSGAILTRNWFEEMDAHARERAGRTAGLVLRLLHGEDADPTFLSILMQFFETLTTSDGDVDAAECLAALRLLRAGGVDAGEIPGGLTGGFAASLLDEVKTNRSEYILRINRGIAASGL